MRNPTLTITLAAPYRGCTHVGMRITTLAAEALDMVGAYGTLDAAGAFVADADLQSFGRTIRDREFAVGLVGGARAAAGAAGAADVSVVDFRRSDIAAHLLRWGIRDGTAWYAADAGGA